MGVLGRIAGLMGVGMLAGCGLFPPAPSAPPHLPAPTTALPTPAKVLSADAKLALAAAEEAIAQAIKTDNAWLVALEYLRRARAAAAITDSENTLLLANETLALCAAARAQLNAPRIPWPRGDGK